MPSSYFPLMSEQPYKKTATYTDKVTNSNTGKKNSINTTNNYQNNNHVYLLPQSQLCMHMLKLIPHRMQL